MIKGKLKDGIRRFRHWQLTGVMGKAEAEAEALEQAADRTLDQAAESGSVKEFYSGSFDSIPFFNEDAKRTFVHLLLRPGYMIRDYLRGQRDRYLAPLTSLIIFYAFLALIASVTAPYSTADDPMTEWAKGIFAGAYQEQLSDEAWAPDTLMAVAPDPAAAARAMKARDKVLGMNRFIAETYVLLHLDTLHDEVNTRLEQSIAAVEAALRGKGVPRFLGHLISLSLCVWLAFRRRYGFSFSASAVTASYILCQFCFFMFFSILVTLGRNDDIGGLLTAALMWVDFHQLLGISWKRSLWETIRIVLLQLAFGVAILLLTILTLGILAAFGAF